jgi:hypothetical protein
MARFEIDAGALFVSLIMLTGLMFVEHRFGRDFAERRKMFHRLAVLPLLDEVTVEAGVDRSDDEGDDPWAQCSEPTVCEGVADISLCSEVRHAEFSAAAPYDPIDQFKMQRGRHQDPHGELIALELRRIRNAKKDFVHRLLDQIGSP